MNSPLLQLTRARIIEFFREPAAIFWVYGFPLLLALILGLAFQGKSVEKLNVDLVETEDAPAAGVNLKEMLQRDGRIVVTANALEAAKERLMTGKTDLVLTPLAKKEGPAFDVWEERNRAESVLARSVVEASLLRQKLGDKAPPFVDHQLEEKGKRYIDFLIPGLIGMNVMGGGIFGVGFVLVDLRVRKLLKRFLATPMRKTDFLGSVMLSRIVFTIPEVMILFLFGWLVFGVACRGSLVSLLAVIFTGAFAFAGIGLLVASRAKTLETASGLMNLVIMPQWILGGVFFSAERFPEAMQPFLQCLPLTALNNALRAIMNDGKGLADVGGQLLVLMCYAVVSFTVALKIFRWR